MIQCLSQVILNVYGGNPTPSRLLANLRIEGTIIPTVFFFLVAIMMTLSYVIKSVNNAVK